MSDITDELESTIENWTDMESDVGDSPGPITTLLFKSLGHIRTLETENAALCEGFQLAADSAGYEGDWHDSAPIRALIDQNAALKALLTGVAKAINAQRAESVLMLRELGYKHPQQDIETLFRTADVSQDKDEEIS